MKKISVKKTIGAIGFFLCFVIGIIGAILNFDAAPVIWPLAALVAAVLGIKSFSGAMIQKSLNNNQQISQAPQQQAVQGK
jgi:hypothetical protein